MALKCTVVLRFYPLNEWIQLCNMYGFHFVVVGGICVGSAVAAELGGHAGGWSDSSLRDHYFLPNLYPPVTPTAINVSQVIKATYTEQELADTTGYKYCILQI